MTYFYFENPTFFFTNKRIQNGKIQNVINNAGALYPFFTSYPGDDGVMHQK